MEDVGLDSLKLLTMQDVADLLQISPKGVRRLILQWRKEPGTGLESVKAGGLIRIDPAAVADYKRRLRQAAGQPAAGAA